MPSQCQKWPNVIMIWGLLTKLILFVHPLEGCAPTMNQLQGCLEKSLKLLLIKLPDSRSKFPCIQLWMTRRIWHCIKSHLRPYYTHPFNYYWESEWHNFTVLKFSSLQVLRFTLSQINSCRHTVSATFKRGWMAPRWYFGHNKAFSQKLIIICINLLDSISTENVS